MITATEPTSAKETRGILSAQELERLQSTTLLLAALLIGIAAALRPIAMAAGSVLFTGLWALSAWCGLITIIHHCFFRVAAKDRREVEYREAILRRSQGSGDPGISDPGSADRLARFAARGQWLILGAGVAIAIFALPHKSLGPFHGEANPLRAGAVMTLTAAGILYLLMSFSVAIQERLKTAALDPLLNLSRLVFGSLLATAGVTFLFLFTTRDLSRWLGWALLSVPAVLAAETFIRFAARFYQPVALRESTAPAGSSFLLDALFGHGRAWRSGVRNIENLVGARIADLWVLGFLRRSAAPALAGMVVCAWLSTCLTVVPTGSRGVRVWLGRYLAPPLSPGLQATLPWPFERVEIIPTERIRALSLGFDKEFAGPVLWTERHSEGEKNLLVGNGETLLTINVPILYRIRDPIAFLQTTSDPDVMLIGLAQRKLLAITGSRESFAIMTEARAEIAGRMKEALQSEADRLSLGLEILFVGMKDIHPPVDVAFAYQEVISAEEEKQSTIDRAHADRADALPSAVAVAGRLTVSADAALEERVAQAEGETARFKFLAAVERANRDLFRLRVRLDALQEALARPAKVILGVPATAGDSLYLDLRNAGGPLPP